MEHQPTPVEMALDDAAEAITAGEQHKALGLIHTARREYEKEIMRSRGEIA